jgi:hypothetical protein
MKNIVQLIREHKFTEIGEQIDNSVPLIMEKKLLELKKAVAAKMCEQMKSASQKIRGELTEDEIEESIDPTEIHNGPAPKGQRVNRDDKGDKQLPNTTVVPKNNLKEEDTNKELPKQTLSKRADNYDRIEVPKATNALATLQTDYGRNSSIGKKAQTAYDSVIAKRNQLEKNAHDARVSQDKDDESSRVKNKLSNAAKGGYITKDYAEKSIYNAKSNIQGGEYAKRHPSQSEPINEEELDEARINLIRARIRGGKIQRRKRVSNVPGMTLRGGTLKRMSAAERRRRKMGARKGKMKRRAKLSRSLMKRKRSLQKRKSLGL